MQTETPEQARLRRIRQAHTNPGSTLFRPRNVAWVQSQAGWTRVDVMKALADADAGRDYHTERPTLAALRK